MCVVRQNIFFLFRWKVRLHIWRLDRHPGGPWGKRFKQRPLECAQQHRQSGIEFASTGNREGKLFCAPLIHLLPFPAIWIPKRNIVDHSLKAIQFSVHDALQWEEYVIFGESLREQHEVFIGGKRFSAYLYSVAEVRAQLPRSLAILSGLVNNVKFSNRGAQAIQFLVQRTQVCFLQTHNHGLRFLFLMVLWDLRTWRKNN